MRRLLLLLALTLGGLGAAEPWFADWEVPVDDPRSPSSIATRHADLHAEGLTPGEELELHRRLRREFVASLAEDLWSGHRTVGRKALAEIDGQIAQLRGLHMEAVADAKEPPADLAQRFARLNSFALDQDATPSYFSGRREIVLARDGVPLLPTTVIVDLRARLDALAAIAVAQNADQREGTIKAIVAASERWDAFVAGGDAQFPWEAWVNGWIDIGPFRADIEHPPRLQLVLLHPSIGFEVPTRELDAVTAHATLIVEAGFVHYYHDSDAGRFWGLSLIANLRDDADPGLGALVHLTPYLNAGVSWRDLPGNDRSRFEEAPSLILGVDLYKLLAPRAATIRTLLR